jgi:RNA polymerase sigma-70 factor (ECF subfamily)
MARPPHAEFERLVRDHHAAVFRSAHRVLGSDDAAADVAQDVFVHVLAGKAALREAESERAVLCWLATRLAQTAARAHRRRRRHEEQAMRTETRDHDDPARRCADADLHDAARARLAELPDELRLPLLLRCQDGLTFASIGTALRLSESAAHERVQRALARLRESLLRAGIAATPAQMLASVESMPEPALPAGLAARLLQLPGRVALGSLAWARGALLAGGALATIAAAAVATGVLDSGRAPASERMAAAVGTTTPATDAPQEPQRTPAPPPASPTAGPAQDPRQAANAADAPITGTVVDAAAWPVPGAKVVVVAAGGLKPFALAETTTDAQGTFRLAPNDGSSRRSLPLPAGSVRTVRVRVLEGPTLLHETADLALPRDPAAGALRIELGPEAGTATSRYSLAVAVVDDAGAPIGGSPVSLYGGGAAKPRPGQQRAEAEATTGADGIARLGGRAPGAKWLFVDGRAAGRIASLAPLDLDRAGEHRTRVALATAGTLAVRIARLDGERIGQANVWLEDDDCGLYHAADVDADAAATFTGLGTGTYTLHARVHGCSAVRRDGLRAGAAVALQLKRADDARDVGDHMAELHGRLVDAATGETVSYGPFELDVHLLRDGDSTWLLDAAIPPPPAQRAAGRERFPAFHLDGLAPGRWLVVAEVPGYAPAVHAATLREGEVCADVRIALQRGATLRGRCIDAAGAAVSGAAIFYVGTGGLADAHLAAWQAHADAAAAGTQAPGAADPSVRSGLAFSRADGSFVLAALPPGVPLRVVASKAGHRLAADVARVLRSGDVTDDLVLQLPRR